MLVPALFVANAVMRASGAPRLPFDVLIFVPPQDVSDAQREWAARRGITLRHDADFSSVQDIAILQPRLSSATLMKLLVPEQVARRYRKLLYLDADLVIEDDIAALFQLDMGEFAIAAVPTGRLWLRAKSEKRDRWLAHFQALGMTPPYRYFNSGVLLIDLANWGRHQLTRRTLDFLRRNGSICHLPDEDSLNAVLDGSLLELSPIWNAPPPSRRTLTRGGIRPVIVHYAGPLKPWMRFRKGKGLLQDIEAYRLYQEFLRDTPWSGWLRKQWTLLDLMQAVRQAAKRKLQTLAGTQSAAREAERQEREATMRRYLAETRFADVEQGITLREGSSLWLAAASPPAASAVAKPGTRRIEA
jgi:lipopolysaccharide biosynthesis glycosyltransferase